MRFLKSSNYLLPIRKGFNYIPFNNNNNNNNKNKKKYSTNNGRHIEEIKIPVPWGYIAGKWWRINDRRPILTLHGWQDNCGSFDRLIPLINENVNFLTIDLPGHGHSSKLPPGMFYNNLNYPIIIKQIKEYFNWSKIAIMGHSLGAISSYVFTFIFPNEVDFVVCIDGLKPLYTENNSQVMANEIRNFLKFDKMAVQNMEEEPPSYTLDELRKKIAESNNNSIDYEYSDYILKRNIAPSSKDPSKYYFTRDPRLKSWIMPNWSQKDLVDYAKRVTCPIFINKSLKSPYYEPKKYVYEVIDVLKQSSKNFVLNYVDGTHHSHLNNPGNLAQPLNKFLEENYYNNNLIK